MDKNRIEDDAEHDERAMSRGAIVTEAKWRKADGCALKKCILTERDLASCLKRLRPCRSENAAKRVVAG
jgi:hypothetical protein